MTNSNEYRPNLISYQFVAKYNWKNIRHAAVLFNPMLDGHGGMDHLTMKRGYPQEYRRPPEEWLDLFRSLPDYNAGHVIAESIRNTFQNLRCIVWTRETGLCQQKGRARGEEPTPILLPRFFQRVRSQGPTYEGVVYGKERQAGTRHRGGRAPARERPLADLWAGSMVGGPGQRGSSGGRPE